MIRAFIVLSTSLLCATQALATGKCTFIEKSGKSVVQKAEVGGAFGNYWIDWDDGGKTYFVKLQDGSFVDEGGNSWIVWSARGSYTEMHRSDGAKLICD